MAVASTVTVNITAETAKFVNGLRKAQKTSRTFAQGVAKSMKVAAASTAAMGAAVAALTARSLKLVDQQTKMAQRLGTTQAALAGLTLAAEQTGTTQQNLQLAMQRSTRRIAEAAQGTGEAVKALKELGLSAKDLAKLSPDKQFLAIAGAMNKVSTQSDRVRLGFKLFDSEGVGLINTLALGEVGMQGFIDKAKELGVAMTDNQTAAIEESNNAIGLMKTAFTGLGNQIAAQVAPILERSAGTITNLTGRVTAAIPQWAAWAAEIFSVKRALDNLTVADLTAELSILDKQLFKEQGIFRGQQLALKTYTDELGNVSPRAADLVANMKIQEGVVGDLTDRYNELVRARAKLKNIGEVAAPGTGLDPAEGGVGITDESVKNQEALLDRLASEYASFRTGQLSTANALADAVATPLERLKERMAELARQQETNPFLKEETVRRQTQAAVAAYSEEIKNLETATVDVFANLNEFQAEAARNSQDIFAEFLFDPFAQGLDGMLKGFVDMLRKMVAQLIASKLLTSFLSLFPGAAASPYANVSGIAVGGTVGPPAAIGGNRAGGTPLLVGERGPEMFTPGASGAVRPLGSVSVTSENNFGGGGDLTAATLIPILEENNKRVKAEILDAFDRGSFA